jgi:penicillin-binding protein 1A
MGYNRAVAASRADARPSGVPKRGKKRKSWQRRLLSFLGISFILATLGCIVGGYYWQRALGQADAMMPQIEAKLAEIGTKPSRILDSSGTHVLQQISAIDRQPVRLSEVPKIVRDAVLEAEDHRFYEHSGIDYIGLARSAWQAREGRLTQGASTLTMQLAKRLHSNGEKTMNRKIMDMALATEMEQKWSKDKIFELYLNQVFFGSGAYGIKAAADVYFGKPLDKLTIAEAAILARCVRRPSDENPFHNLDKAIENRNVVLRSMEEDGKITSDEYKKAIHEKVHLNKHRRTSDGVSDDAPYVVSAAEAELHANYPDIHLADGGYDIYTTVDWDIQQKTEDAVRDVVREHRGQGVNSAAFVLMDGEGRVISEVGGVDFRKDQYNVVTQGHRQPGSSFKPFVYSAAFAAGALDPAGTVSNERLDYVDPSTGKHWSPKNDNGKYGGQISVRSAVANSVNVAAARTLLDVGVDSVVSMGHDVFGFKSDLPAVPSLALGVCSVEPIEMAQAYSVFMLRGSRATPFLIGRIQDSDGHLLYENAPKVVRNVLSSGVCEDIDTLLRAVVTGGTGTRAGIVPDAHGKTGTTSDNKDAWFCGFANGLVGVGWVGNIRYVAAGKDENGKPRFRKVMMPMSRSVFGGTVTAGMWAQVEKAAFEKFGTRYAKAENIPLDENDRFGAVARDPNADGDPAIPATDQTTSGGVALPVDPKQDPNQVQPPPGLPVQGPDAPVRVPNPPDPTIAKPAPKPQRHGPTAPVRTDQDQYVEVNVCADTGLLANPYCPETVTRKFLKGHEPKRTCTKHHE